MRSRSAFTLIELTLVLAILAALAAVATPLLGHGRRVLSVHNAATELAGLIALTRATAIATGGATLVIDLGTGTAAIESAAGLRSGDPQPIAPRHGVTLAADRTSPLRIRYDALGIGRLAATTIRIASDDVRATVIISSYGRVRL